MTETIKNLINKIKDFVSNLLSFGCYKVWYVNKDGKILTENIVYGTRKSVRKESENYGKKIPDCHEILYLDCFSQRRQ